MNIRQIEAYRAIVLSGTVNGAALLLGLSQPSVSRLLSDLERTLGVTLFDRSKGRLVHTPEGKLIFEEVERTMRGLDRVRELAIDLKDAQVGHLSIASMPALGSGFLPAVMAAFSRHHPNIKISLNILSSTKVEDWVAAQHGDFGLAEIPYNREDVLVDEFCNSPYFAALPKNHALCDRHQITPEAFDELPFVSMTQNSPSRHIIDRYFQDRQINRKLLVETSALSSTCELVKLGMGVGLVDPFNIVDYQHDVVARVLKPVVDFKVGLLYPRHRPLSKVARKFIEFMKTTRDHYLKQANKLATRATP